ncbi:Uncharacterized protein BP5553_05719 [Venustampulla echinocandica]|uniref:Uncharacterized protein n=1 Tax=Venustampulla echinocandica TaxID=2656787 RepID=A0A370TLJ1_9HELO|nr:Uncharacterized protein BP5553_05719 [Venustampulla echinocandica]RDL36367.1 Uncharacterized protein BP5553_05719 [Venustampulla echinocandica]
MSRFWPHSPYAEDQPFSHAILYTHVLTRAVQAGSVLGTGAGASIFFLRHFGILKPRIAPSTFTTTLLRSTGIGTVIGTGILAVALPMMMRGKDEIEWQDRSWRLLENRGQVECDDWTYVGMATGTVAAVVRGKVGELRWKGLAGGLGAGSVAGMVGYMAWRYGVKGGKWEENIL